MLKDKERWEIQVLHQSGNSIRRIRQITHHDRKTIRNVLTALSPGASPVGVSGGQPAKLRRSGKRSALEPFKELLRVALKRRICMGKLLLELRAQGFSGSRRSLRRFLRASKAKIITTAEQTNEWMHLVLQGARTSAQIKQDVADALTGDEVTTLVEYVRTKPLKMRNRALALLAHGNQITPGRIASFLCVLRSTTRKYVSNFKRGGIQCVLHRSPKSIKKADDPNYTAHVFKTLHAPPSTFGFNRTTWRMDDLHDILLKQGVRISRATISKIIRGAG